MKVLLLVAIIWQTANSTSLGALMGPICFASSGTATAFFPCLDAIKTLDYKIPLRKLKIYLRYHKLLNISCFLSSSSTCTALLILRSTSFPWHLPYILIHFQLILLGIHSPLRIWIKLMHWSNHIIVVGARFSLCCVVGPPVVELDHFWGFISFELFSFKNLATLALKY